MKIAFDAKRALNNSTGLGNHNRILLNALMRYFPENEYLLFTPRAKSELFHQLNGDFKLELPASGLQKSLHSIWRSYGMTKQIKKQRINVFHGLSNELPFNIQRESFAKIVTIHDLIFLKHVQQYPFFDRQIYKLKTQYAAKHADKIIAVSQETKNELIEYFKIEEEKIEVIFPGIDMKFWSSEQKASLTEVGKRRKNILEKFGLPQKYILNVGSFFPRKNQHTLIEAFNLVKNKVEEDLVLIGGAGNKLKETEDLVYQKNLGGRVKIIKQFPNEDLPVVYQGASAFVYPSLYEGFGMPIAEALISRVPVIATRGGCFKEAGGENSIYIDPLNAEEMAEAILKVLSDENLRKQMTESGYRHALTMTDDDIATKTMKVYCSFFTG